MFKKFIDELTILDEYSRKTVDDLKDIKKEDFKSILKRVDIFQAWLNGICDLRGDLPCRKLGECQ